MLLLSIQPRFADAILAGTKTVELRRQVPRVAPGDEVLVYSTIPTGAVIGLFTVEEVVKMPLRELWRRSGPVAGVSRGEFNAYFSGLETGVGIHIQRVRRFESPVSLITLRNLWPGFHPPQSFRYLDTSEVEALLQLTSKRRSNRLRAA